MILGAPRFFLPDNQALRPRLILITPYKIVKLVKKKTPKQLLSILNGLITIIGN